MRDTGARLADTLYLLGSEDFSVQLWCTGCPSRDGGGHMAGVYAVLPVLDALPADVPVVATMAALIELAAGHRCTPRPATAAPRLAAASARSLTPAAR